MSIKTPCDLIRRCSVMKRPLPLYPGMELPGIKVSSLNNLGEVYQKQGLFARALATYDSVLQIRQNMDQNIPRNRTRLARAHLNLASVFIDVREYLQARDHLQIAYAIFKEEEDLSGLGKCSILLGNVAFFQSDLEEAEVIYKNTLEAYTEFLEPVDQAKVLRNLGSVMMRKGDTGKASEYYRQSEPYFAVSRDSHLMASIAYERGNVFIQSDQLDSALYYYANSGRLLAEGDLQTATLLYAQLAEAHLEKGDSATALAFLQKYQEAFQGLSNAERDVIHYQLKEEKLNRELAESKNEVLLFRSGLLITGLILVLLIAGIIVYRSRQARQRAKKEVDEMIQSVEMKIEKAQSQAQEMERKRISDELHDSVGSQLTAIRYNYEAIIQKLAELKKEVKSEFSMNTQKLAAVQEEVRSLSHELKEGFWEKFGLITRLQAFRDEMNAAGGIEVELSLFGLKERLNDETERQVYPIIQELTANALKHSKAKLLSIQLSAFEDSLSIMVEDDGVGFDLENALTKPGLGLENLKERVESLQGNLKIDSRPGRGTTVMIEEIPLPKIG